MLIPDYIPETEPEINVGIILPEDQISNFTLSLPLSPVYQLITEKEKTNLPAGCQIAIEKSKDGLKVNIKNELFLCVELEINPLNYEKKIHNQAGIKVEPVIAGRGFHWQKHIKIFLPDSLIIKKHEDSLILINKLPLEHYVMCVATSEMSAECPESMIEAQTIAARSWMLANVEQKHRHMQMDVCNDDCCQRYQGTTFLSSQSVEGALNTSGKVLLYKSKICDARYSKSCGGMMEVFSAIWPGNDEDYLQNLPDTKNNIKDLSGLLNTEENAKKWILSNPETFCSPHIISEDSLKKYLGNVDEEGQYFRWKVTLKNDELCKSLNKYAGIEASQVTNFEVLSRGGSGRINKLRLLYKKSDQKIYELLINSEYNVRRFLSEKFLYSSAISIEKVSDSKTSTPNFNLHGAGWGHGVGLCQIGALGMSLEGYTTDDILYHYYPGSQLKKIY